MRGLQEGLEPLNHTDTDCLLTMEEASALRGVDGGGEELENGYAALSDGGGGVLQQDESRRAATALRRRWLGAGAVVLVLAGVALGIALPLTRAAGRGDDVQRDNDATHALYQRLSSNASSTTLTLGASQLGRNGTALFKAALGQVSAARVPRCAALSSMTLVGPRAGHARRAVACCAAGPQRDDR